MFRAMMVTLPVLLLAPLALGQDKNVDAVIKQLENFAKKEDIKLALSTVHARTEQYLAGLEESQLT